MIFQDPRLSGLAPVEVGAVVSSEVAAMQADTSSAWRAISIGVATGALTFVVTRLLERMFK